MGRDGHIASIFANSPASRQLLDPHNHSSCLLAPAHPGGPRQPRISLTLGAILRARRVMLVIRGHEKLGIVNRALDGPEPVNAPIATLLRQEHNPIEVLWSP
jgi:6-phosphogluconolactonase